MNIGLTLGKFLPFHQGHELLLQTAAACVDQLIVLIGYTDEDPIPLVKRQEWVSKAIGGYPHIILGQKELDKDAPKDEFGTIVDEKYWNAWLVDTAQILDKVSPDAAVTHVFTSDKYGQRIAEEIGARWYPVDPDREIIPISGTQVRIKPVGNFQFLPSYVKPSFVKKVALLGPESTGKSQLVKTLAKHFSCPWVPEYGRTVSVAHDNDLKAQDFEAILYGQDEFINNAVRRATDVPLVVSDTDALVTALYHEYFEISGGIGNEAFLNFARNQTFDIRIVLSPSVPWVDDGSRFMTEIDRWKFYYAIIEKLREWKLPFELIEHSDYTYRTAKAIQIVNKLLYGNAKD